MGKKRTTLSNSSSSFSMNAPREVAVTTVGSVYPSARLRSQCKVILLSLKFFVNKTFDATVATVTSLDAFMNELHPKGARV